MVEDYEFGLLEALGLSNVDENLRYSCFPNRWPWSFLGFLAFLAAGGRKAVRCSRAGRRGGVYVEVAGLPDSKPVMLEVPSLGGYFLYPALSGGKVTIAGVRMVKNPISIVSLEVPGGRPVLAVAPVDGGECVEGLGVFPAVEGEAGLTIAGGYGHVTIRFSPRSAVLWARGPPSPELLGSPPVWLACGVEVEAPMIDVLQYVFEEGVFDAIQAVGLRGAWLLAGTLRSRGVEYAVAAGWSTPQTLGCLEEASRRSGAAFRAVPLRRGYGFTSYLAGGSGTDAENLATNLKNCSGGLVL